ncbi:hypothetical protein MC885_008395 [Smutsia gigantea]|nr:hypothetical protein MC885_008395 [Smutsia gigantea]
MVLSTVVVFTCVASTVGNSVVVWLLSCHIQETPFCLYILHLAVADLLFLFCMAYSFGLEPTYPVAYEVAQRVKYLAYTTGLSLPTAISTERCISVLFPIWEKGHQPRHLSSVVCAVLWALSLLMDMPASFFCSKYWHCNEQQCFVVDSVFSFLTGGIFTPVMRRHSQRWRQRPTQLYVLILASVFMFLSCTLPLGLYWFILYWVDLPQQTKALFQHTASLFSSVSRSANLIIYFVVGRGRHQGQREAPGAVLRGVLQEEPELEERETPSTSTNQVGV